MSGLNKSILDQGWYEFRRQLDYELAWNGGYLVAVPPQNTSRTCPCCGHMSADNRLTQALFKCVECGFEENADVVGTINVLREEHTRLACEVNGAVIPSANLRQRYTPLERRRNLRPSGRRDVKEQVLYRSFSNFPAFPVAACGSAHT